MLSLGSPGASGGVLDIEMGDGASGSQGAMQSSATLDGVAVTNNYQIVLGDTATFTLDDATTVVGGALTFQGQQCHP